MWEYWTAIVEEIWHNQTNLREDGNTMLKLFPNGIIEYNLGGGMSEEEFVIFE